jgi:hypothetical protein
LAEILRGGLLASVGDRDPVRRPVVVHDLGVVDRDAGRPLLEVFDRVLPARTKEGFRCAYSRRESRNGPCVSWNE